MRGVSAVSGTLLVPLAYLTLSHMGFSVVGCSLGALMVLTENLFVAQTV
jgi:dolichyl-phosphate-mannose--protein O-mannosyl transferase